MQTWSFPTDWPLSLGVTRLIWVRLSLRLAPSPRRPGLHDRGFADRITPVPRPAGFMANGSFQGKLLSAYETKTVSLTHRRHGGALLLRCPVANELLIQFSLLLNLERRSRHAVRISSAPLCLRALW